MESLFKQSLRIAAVVLSGLLQACSGGGSSSTSPPIAPAPDAAENDVIEFRCLMDENCPELQIDGDPLAQFDGGPAPFRGYGDPSLSYDADSDTLWMSYSWLSMAVRVFGPPPEPDILVNTNLARSTDNGGSFQFVRSINTNELVDHPDTGESGWLTHEVSTITRQADGNWQALWLQYFDPVGETERKDFLFNRSVASEVTGLGDDSQAWIRTAITSAAFGAELRLAHLDELSDCTVFTEPALFTQGGQTYLALNCLVVVNGERVSDEERLFLLRQNGDSYDYVGVLMDSDDASAVGGDVVEQADFAVARDGSLLLMVTPIRQEFDPPHQGCVVLEVDNIATATMARAANNELILRARITADGDALGPGLCSYHAQSDTGIILVIPKVFEDPIEVVFSMHATGVHP